MVEKMFKELVIALSLSVWRLGFWDHKLEKVIDGEERSHSTDKLLEATNGRLDWEGEGEGFEVKVMVYLAGYSVPDLREAEGKAYLR